MQPTLNKIPNRTHPIKSFRELIVWQEAVKLAQEIYQTTKNFPKEELYGLISQIRRSSISVSANIAEGWARNSRAQFNQFLSHALGSLAETESHIEIALRVQYLSDKESGKLFDQCNKTGFLLRKMLDSLNKA